MVVLSLPQSYGVARGLERIGRRKAHVVSASPSASEGAGVVRGATSSSTPRFAEMLPDVLVVLLVGSRDQCSDAYSVFGCGCFWAFRCPYRRFEMRRMAPQ